MAKFNSTAAYLILQDGVPKKDIDAAIEKGDPIPDGVWATFENHEFSTTDKAVIARLKKVEGVKAGAYKPDDEVESEADEPVDSEDN